VKTEPPFGQLHVFIVTSPPFLCCQGFVLDAAPLSFLELDELPSPPAEGGLSAAAPVWVALDEVVDPQNFGAVLRSAYFLGAGGVLTCARNSSPLT
jgi:21S rRNA (GM2251-2'-O)-methyltransferase